MSAGSGAHVEPHQRRGQAEDHRLAVDRAGDRRAELEARVELVDGDVVAVRPDADLRVVVEPARRREHVVVEVVRPERVRRLRHREALVAALGGEQRELGEHPAVSELIVDDDRISVVLRLARAAEAGPRRVARRRPGHEVAALVIDRDRQVDPLDVVVGADVAVDVGWPHLEADGRGVVGVRQTVEAQGRRGRRLVAIDGALDLRARRRRVDRATIAAHRRPQVRHDAPLAGLLLRRLRHDLAQRRRLAAADRVDDARLDRRRRRGILEPRAVGRLLRRSRIGIGGRRRIAARGQSRGGHQ